MSHTCPQKHSKTASEVVNCSVDFTGKLDSGELLTGTPTVTELTSSDLTISSVAVSTSTLTINGVSVATGAAVTYSVSGGTADTDYTLIVTCGTDATPAQTRVVRTRLTVDTD